MISDHMMRGRGKRETWRWSALAKSNNACDPVKTGICTLSICMQEAETQSQDSIQARQTSRVALADLMLQAMLATGMSTAVRLTLFSRCL